VTKDAWVDVVEGTLDVKKEGSSKSAVQKAGINRGGKNGEIVEAGFSLSEAELKRGKKLIAFNPPRETSVDHFLEDFEERLSKRDGAEFPCVAFGNEEDEKFIPGIRKNATRKNIVEYLEESIKNIVWKMGNKKVVDFVEAGRGFNFGGIFVEGAGQFFHGEGFGE
jgi:hypothetical protein